MSTDIREQHIDWIMTKCVHFNGIQNKTCRAGVNYHELLGNGVGCFARMPCTCDPNPSVACDKIQLMTREEAEADVDLWMARMEANGVAVKAAHDDAKAKGFKRGQGGVSSLKCPTCPDGTLKYSVASVNGHMHARCTTKGCHSWME